MKTTLEDILNIALDVCDDERGTYGRLHFVAYCAGQLQDPLCFLVHKTGEKELPWRPGVRCYSKSQIKERAESEEVKQVVGMAEQRHEEEIRVRKAVDTDKDKTYKWVRRKNGIREFPELWKYTDEKYICLRQLNSKKAYARIDFVFGVPGGYVFLEVDEDQHRAPGYENNVSGDMKRMEDVMRAYKNGRNRLPVLWLRYNPDASKFVVYQSQGDTPETVPQCTDRKERERLLINHLESIDLSEEAQGGWKIEYAFYDARVVSGNTIAETTEIPTYAEAYRNLSTVPTISTIFAWDPNYAPARINDVEAPDSDTTDDDTMLPEYQVLYAEPYQQETYDSQGTDECDIMNDSPNF